MRRLPKLMYISLENEGETDEYFQPSVHEKDIPFTAESKFVGIYELQEVVEVEWELKLHKKKVEGKKEAQDDLERK